MQTKLKFNYVMPKFRVSNGALNAHGGRVITAGIDLTRFNANPQLFYMHDWCSNLGKWENIEKMGDELLMVPIFDEDDEFAVSIKKKVDKGFLKAASIGIEILEMSNDPSVMLSGQTRPTITKCSLLEVSIVTLPANPEACTLHKVIYKGETLNLGATNDLLKLDYLFNNQSNKKPIISNMKDIALKLGLSADATDAQIQAAIEAMQSNRIEGLIALGKTKGVVTAENEAIFRKMAAKDFENTSEFINQSQALETAKTTETTKVETKQESMADLIAEVKKLNTQSSDKNDKSNWTFEEYSKKDPKGLLEIKNTDPERYKKLAASY